MEGKLGDEEGMEDMEGMASIGELGINNYGWGSQ